MKNKKEKKTKPKEKVANIRSQARKQGGNSKQMAISQEGFGNRRRSGEGGGKEKKRKEMGKRKKRRKKRTRRRRIM